MDGIMNLSEHMTVIDNEGNKTSVIMYYADYQEIVDIIGRYKMLFEFESSLNASLDQMKQMKTDKSANKSLQSLIDEL